MVKSFLRFEDSFQISVKNKMTSGFSNISIITDVSESIGYSAHTESRRDQDINTFFKQSPKGKAYIVLIKDEF